jgi:hypothetical protein
MAAERWWPFRLGDADRRAVASFRTWLSSTPQVLDLEAAERAVAMLDAQMAAVVDEIVGRDGLPHHAHLINGWGDATLADGSKLVDGLAGFVHRGSGGRGLILQKHPEGEVHPWQSLAYAFMAGADPDAPLGSSPWTLRGLAEASRWLNTTEGEELGHLLYALARLGPGAEEAGFTLGDGSHADLERLAVLAVEAHLSGHFDVCRKTHLTEGLCAAVAVFPQLASIRSVAEGFLAGQLDSLELLGALLAEVSGSPEEVAPEGKGRSGHEPDVELVRSLQGILALDGYVENHFYWAGHVMEIAGLATIDGFPIADHRWHTMVFVANQANRLLPTYLPATWFPGCYLHFGHYRRGLTLLMARHRAQAEGRELSSADLTHYAADFTSGPAGSFSPSPAPGAPLVIPGDDDLLQVAPPEPGPDDAFVAILDAYGRRARPGFAAQGAYAHFRRVIPPGWPRALHYELMMEGGSPAIELHIESETAKPLGPSIAASVIDGRLAGVDGTVEWDPAWYGGRGRLRLRLEPDLAPDEIAARLAQLIEATHPLLDDRARALATPASPAELAAPAPGP